VISMNNGLRRVGIVGLSTLVAASMMTFSAATTYAAAGDYAAASTPLVTAPQTAALAGNLSLEFANNWTTGASQTFTVGSNNCLTAPGIAAAVGFSALPTATVTDPGAPNVGGTMPTPTAVLSSSSPACATALITDRITYTQAAPSTGVVTDTYLLALTVVKYNVGTTTPAGNISVATAGSFKTSGTVVNAVVAGATLTNTAKVLAVPAATASLGTQTLAENTPGAFFGAGSSVTTVTLTLSGTSLFTAGITPTITLPTGYTHSTVVTAAAGTYVFTVTSPVTPVAATMTITGLTITAGAATDVTLTVTGGVVNPSAVTVVRIVNYTARTGGSDRYATAVTLLNLLPPDPDVVLASGVNFPDALSANYLAGRLTTGTLLTTPNTLPTVVRAAIFSRGVSTVYITGGTGAVSQAVQDQIEAMHVGNVPGNPFIIVVRLGGANRYATNQLINQYNFLPSGTVLLATGKNFADALTVGPIANRGLPLILTQGVTLGAGETAQLSNFSPTKVIIAGGTGVVSQAIQDSLTASGYTVVRLAGLDRTLTAAAVATYATTSLAFNTTTAYVTTGNNFADALAAGPVAGVANNVIMPTNSPTSLGAGIPLYFGTKTVGVASPANIGTLHALGLTGAVSNAVMISAAMAIG